MAKANDMCVIIECSSMPSTNVAEGIEFFVGETGFQEGLFEGCIGDSGFMDGTMGRNMNDGVDVPKEAEADQRL
jgi:hypothetical protein